MSNYEKWIFGVSLNTSAYWNIERFNKACRKMFTESNDWKLLIGDYLDRHNYEFKLRNDQTARDPHKMCQRFVSQIVKVSEASEVERVDWRDSLVRAQERGSKQFIEELYTNHAEFRNLVNDDVEGFIRRNGYEGDAADDCRTTSKNYILEEISVFRQLCDEGYTRFAYMGDFVISARYLSEHSGQDMILSKAKFINLNK